MAKKVNNKSVLFLYEGETEGEFYPLIFKSKIPNRTFKIRSGCLHGNYNINNKVADAIYSYFDKHEEPIHVFIALDREGKRNVAPPIDVSLIKKEFKGNRLLLSIDLIVATQDLESWLFSDINNVLGFLRVPHSQRNPDKFKIFENFNNRDLSRLFKSNGKLYQKGKRVENFLNNLDMENIYNSCQDLRKGVDLIIKKFS